MKLVHFMLVLLIHLVIAIKNPNEKCEFKDTVDVTNQTRFENGSFLYQNILIPEHQLAYYDYILQFRNKSQDAELHLRGCICGAQQQRFCMKLCCDHGQYFNKTNNQCQDLPQDRKAPTDMIIRLRNVNRHRIVNIFKHFVVQVGLPCEKPEILLEDEDIWDLTEDGILRILSDTTDLDTVSYCFTPHRFKGSDEDVLTAMSCPMKNEVTMSLLLNTYAMAVSVVFLIPTILVYFLIKEMRDNLGGKLLICYLISMATAYTIITFINIKSGRLDHTTCSVLGYIGYFFFMSVFIWLSVLCFDIWNNFKEANIDFNARNNKLRFAIYSLYGWGSAGLLTSFVVWAQLSDDVEDLYKPGIGIDICWLDTRKWSAALYFYWPNCIILIFNIIIFIHMTLRIYRVRTDVAKMTNRESFMQENAAVIMRLFLIMGISWIMDIISYCLRNFKEYDFLFTITDFCNAIQGVLIFVLFILKPKVKALIAARVQSSKLNVIFKIKSPKPVRPKLNATSRETTFSRLTSSTATTGSTGIAVSP